jgi:putative oxidoreductase
MSQPSSGLPVLYRSITTMLEAMPLSPVQLMLRVGVASVFFKSGWVKTQSWQSTVMLFEYEYDVPVLGPETAAYIGTIFELAMPILIGIGLLTRLAVLPLLGMTIVIEIFVYPLNWSEHLIWFAILFFLLIRGPGAISIDHLLGPTVARWLGVSR